MTIFYEDSLLYAAAFLADFADIRAFNHAALTADDLSGASALLVRSTTRVDQALLSQAKDLRFVATGTAGFNHLDTDYLNQRDIPWYSAAGCNAIAVAEYVLSALWIMAGRKSWKLAEKSIGIVGAGHVGSALAERCEVLGMRVKLCDPPLAEQGDPRELVDLNQIVQCDFISLHVPLVTQGEHPTYHLFDYNKLQQLDQDQVLINACRGDVVDNQAALALFKRGQKLNLVLDVWENEPDVLRPLIPHVALATPHIAGHSLEGKARGSEMIYQQLCLHWGKPCDKKLSELLPRAPMLRVDGHLELSLSQQLCLQAYDIVADDQAFRQRVMTAERFTHLRKHYPVRREYNSYQITTDNYLDYQVPLALGFNRA